MSAYLKAIDAHDVESESNSSSPREKQLGRKTWRDRMRSLRSLLLAGLGATLITAASIPIGGQRLQVREAADGTNGLVTYDEHSLMIKGERVLFYSGEYHPFRLPVPSLWLDVFQKIKALGFNGVSFYIDWALLEGEPGVFRADGIFDLQPFFDAAKTAGIYLLARPGPYINAEVSGGGFPGWQARNPATLRTAQTGYMQSTNLYMSSVGALIAKNQITNGGPIVLVQPENEYTQGPACCDANYFGMVEQQLRSAGIVVPLISNDASPDGHFVTGPAAVDIYGYDGYPLGFDCANPSSWGSNSLPTYFAATHASQAPNTPHSIVEFQGGSFDPWGGVGFDKCTALLGTDFTDVFYKNNIAAGVKLMNLYMTFGGSNWGNLGHPGGYSSYDYGSAIAEDRTVTRQKYSENKLVANSIRSLPAHLTSVAQSNANAAGAYTGNSNVYVTALFSNTTKFFIARQTSFTSTFGVTYKLTLPTSQGNLTVPQLGGSLSINGRDTKIHVADGDLEGINLLYTTAEIFTFQKYSDSYRVLLLFGKAGEQHEFAVTGAGNVTQVEGQTVQTQTGNGTTIVNWKVSNQRSVLKFSNGLLVYIVNKPQAYGYWVLDSSPSATTPGLPIIDMQTGYLVRNVTTSGSTINIVGDLNKTSNIEVLGAQAWNSITFNGQKLTIQRNYDTGALRASASYVAPTVNLPNLATVGWKTYNSLPEINNDFTDDKWTAGTLTYTNNTSRPGLNTAANLYAEDYGYQTGSLIYRGHFTSDGTENSFYISPQGGTAFGYSLWLNQTFIGSGVGDGNDYYLDDTYPLPALTNGTNYVFTVLIDHMGHEEDWEAGTDSMKQPRGVMQYKLGNRASNAISWKLTGNLGGEKYVDKVRGPLNEGGMWFERHGYHQPGAPTSNWPNSNGPTDGITKAGVQFYTTTFDLNLPAGYDIPLALDFGSNSLNTGSNYRCQVYVNGYQYGKFVSNIGPQTKYPVPEGIWNYHGSNTVAVSLWALDAAGAKPPQFNLVAGFPVQSGYGPITLSPAPAWSNRAGVY